MHMMFVDESGDPGYPKKGNWKGWGGSVHFARVGVIASFHPSEADGCRMADRVTVVEKAVPREEVSKRLVREGLWEKLEIRVAAEARRSRHIPAAPRPMSRPG